MEDAVEQTAPKEVCVHAAVEETGTMCSREIMLRQTVTNASSGDR